VTAGHTREQLAWALDTFRKADAAFHLAEEAP